MRAYPVFQFCASMLSPSRRIGTAELHKGAILFDIVKFTDCHRATYMSTCEKITRTKCHLYLELNAKRASVRSINMHARKKTHVLLYLFAKDTACTREKSPRHTFRSSSKDTAIELMYINMHVRGNVWNWQLLKIRLTYRNHTHVLIECRTLDKRC